MMRERLVTTATGTTILLRADASAEALDWLGASLEIDTPEIADGTGRVVGTVLCRFQREGDALTLCEADLDAPERPVSPTHTFPASRARSRSPGSSTSSTRAIPMRRLCAKTSSTACASPSARAGTPRSLLRPALGDGAWGSHTGWAVFRDDTHMEETGEVSLRDVIETAPDARALRDLATGHCDPVAPRHARCARRRSERPAPRLVRANDSFVARGSSSAPRHVRSGVARGLVARLRESPNADLAMLPVVLERLFVSYDSARDLLKDAARFVARDALHDLAFVRRLRTLLRQGREAVALHLIAETGKLAAEDAKVFLDGARDAISAGKVPPRTA